MLDLFDERFCDDGVRTLTRADLLRQAHSLTIQNDLNTDICIGPASPATQMTMTCAVALAGGRVILGWRPGDEVPQGAWLWLTGEDQINSALSNQPTPAKSNAPTAKALGQLLAARFQDTNGPNFYFYTSGSSGKKKLVAKTWNALVCEAQMLRSEFSIEPGDTIETLVPPWHIYGFLYGFLVPYISGARVRYSHEREVSGDHDVIIAVPALWKIVMRGCRSARLILTSGAPLPLHFAQEIYASGYEGKIADILGSTETGGIGYRYCDDDRPHGLFPGVNLSPVAQGATLTSDYTFPPNHPQILSDRLELVGPRQFIHQGRTDRVIKVGSKRFSLTEIEDNLRSVLPSTNQTILCRYEANGSAKGGSLTCFHEGPAVDPLAARLAYAARFQTPFPEGFVAVSRLTNAMGKLVVS